MTDDKYLPVRAVAELLGESRSTVYRRIVAGELDAIDIGRAGSTRLRVPESSLRTFLARSGLVRV